MTMQSKCKNFFLTVQQAEAGSDEANAKTANKKD
jgi:hypothetical protein